MSVLKAEQISEEERHEVIAEAVIGKPPVIPGVEIVRGITPLAMIVLQKANNPYITNRKGFAALGVEFDKSGKLISDAAQFGMVMMPKTAEMLAVFSCTREQLKQFASDPAALEDATFELLDTLTTKQLKDATLVISEQLEKLSKSQATQDPDEEKPSAASLETMNGKKKHNRTG